MKVKLDRERELAIDLNAMCYFAEVRGYELWEVDLKRPKSADLRAMLWCALLKEDPQISLEEAGAMLDGENMALLQTQLMGAIADSMPHKDDGPPNAASKLEAESGSGSKSGP